MIAAIIPIHEFSKVEEAYECLRLIQISMQTEISEVEKLPRHIISHESIILSQLDGRLRLIETAMAKLAAVSKIANEGYATKADINQSISASQPYNAGSRENY